VQGPTGGAFCSRSCAANSSGQCGGAQCHKTNVSGLYVCGDPNAGNTAPPPPNTMPPPPNNPSTNPDTQAPKVVITSPAAQAELKPNFVVRAKVTDDIAVVKVELFVDGKLYATKGALHHDFPVSLQPGTHTLRVVGHDAATKKGAGLIQVKVVSSTGAQNQTPPPPPAGTFSYGASCSSGNQCNSGICANDLTLNQQYCTQTCDPVGLACPTGSDCYPTSGGSYVCAPLLDANAAGGADPETVGAGMSCSMAGNGAPSVSLVLVLGLLLLGLIRRDRF
jgi:MYXO-CTERM domain-containing protein